MPNKTNYPSLNKSDPESTNTQGRERFLKKQQGQQKASLRKKTSKLSLLFDNIFLSQMLAALGIGREEAKECAACPSAPLQKNKTGLCVCASKREKREGCISGRSMRSRYNATDTWAITFHAGSSCESPPVESGVFLCRALWLWRLTQVTVRVSEWAEIDAADSLPARDAPRRRNRRPPHHKPLFWANYACFACARSLIHCLRGECALDAPVCCFSGTLSRRSVLLRPTEESWQSSFWEIGYRLCKFIIRTYALCGI